MRWDMFAASVWVAASSSSIGCGDDDKTKKASSDSDTAQPLTIARPVSVDALTDNDTSSSDRGSIVRATFDTQTTLMRSIGIQDKGSGEGLGGSMSGFDVDAVLVSTQRCDDERCLRDLAASGGPSSLTGSPAVFFRGGQESPGPNMLHGTDDDGIDLEEASLSAFDASHSSGYLSLGDHGFLGIDLPAPMAGRWYAYIGEVAGNSPPDAIDVFAQNAAMAPRSHGGTLSPGGNVTRLLAGDSTVLLVPPASVSAATTIRIEEAPAVNGAVRVNINRTLASPALLSIKGVARAVQVTSAQPPAIIASAKLTSSTAVRVSTTSTLAFAATSLESCGANCGIQELDFAIRPRCAGDVSRLFSDWLRRTGIDPDPEPGALGITTHECVFPEALDASIVLGGSAAAPTLEIPEHQPTVRATSYYASRDYLRRMDRCSRAEADQIADWIATAEADHQRIDRDHTEMWGPIEVLLPPKPAVLSDAEFKRLGYILACDQFIDSVLTPRHNAIHPHPDVVGVSDACEACAADPGAPSDAGAASDPRCATATYCPCEDPNTGKPRSYATQIECAVHCPSGLRCFAVLCTREPGCPAL